MPPYTEELDEAWIEGRTHPAPGPVEPQPVLHPEVHALRQALEQLRAARYWSQTDPAVRAACRAVAAEIAEELRHHTDDTAGDEDGGAPRGAGAEAIHGTAVESPSTGPAPGPRPAGPTGCGDRVPGAAASRAGSKVRSAAEALAGRRHRAEQARGARGRHAGQNTADAAPNEQEGPGTPGDRGRMLPPEAPRQHQHPRSTA